MGYSIFSLVMIIPGVISLVAQWMGLLAMRGQKVRGWKLMMAGAISSTLGPLGTIVLLLAQLGDRGAVSGMAIFGVFMPGVASVFGGLLFSAGFGIHGLASRAAFERQQQLESMTAAMAEELRVLRERLREV